MATSTIKQLRVRHISNVNAIVMRTMGCHGLKGIDDGALRSKAFTKHCNKIVRAVYGRSYRVRKRLEAIHGRIL